MVYNVLKVIGSDMREQASSKDFIKIDSTN